MNAGSSEIVTVGRLDTVDDTVCSSVAASVVGSDIVAVDTTGVFIVVEGSDTVVVVVGSSDIAVAATVVVLRDIDESGEEILFDTEKSGKDGVDDFVSRSV